jgi:LmbE family N-acetylglucosaminyl deacetylase/SAM-dependent methyltransferase
MTDQIIQFDHLTAGTSEAVWQMCVPLQTADAVALPDLATRLLVLAAHPDDECLGAGGVLALAEAAGHVVDVIIASDGQASHPNSPTHSSHQLAMLRREEAGVALATVAPHASLTYLGLPDGELGRYHEALVAALNARISSQPAGPCWLFAPWQDDHHPDHQACSTAAREMARRHQQTRLWEYPIWAWHWGTPADLPFGELRRVQLPESAYQAKLAAIDCYRSQYLPLSDQSGDEAVLSAAVTAHFARSFETFIEIDLDRSEVPDYFDALYAVSDDPWGLEERFYEVRKRAILLATLPRERFTSAFEPGCATGLLTRALAQRCDRVLATDIADRAIELTRARVAGSPGVSVEHRRIPQEWPDATFDLIVLSEVGYYCRDLRALKRRVRDTLSPDGVLVACHWLHPASTHEHPAQLVHAVLGAGLHRLVHHEEEDFLLEVFSPNADSVARASGIVGRPSSR